eukprot:TRINITY_DN12335_c0_g10_i2.p1 TRINITY_DN12335_c0_g10~~TRINITY_DN12335_c0_g10_i2.p1  ORF type:complete len:756 (+),score=107.02 TRINITY_DN12335_c0_g10_i2:69-2336(+)
MRCGRGLSHRIKTVMLSTTMAVSAAFVLVLLSGGSDAFPLFGSPSRGSDQGPIPDGVVPVATTIFNGDETRFDLCPLDFTTHAEKPWETPMFKDLVARCPMSKRMSRTVAQLKELPSLQKPDGFIFHQSRVGSTLIANMLASDPDNLVYAESSPPALIALRCTTCSRQDKIEMLRVVVNAMANSNKHKRLFFKFQSVQSTVIDLYLEAFPNTPWVFLYREPNEILASQLRNKMGPAPCLRPDRSASKAFSPRFGPMTGREKLCAEHLNKLAVPALQELNKSGDLGAAINYNELPNIVTDWLMPVHFGFPFTDEIKAKMMKASEMYSKARLQPAHRFTSDSSAKQERARGAIAAAAQQHMMDSYRQLEELAAQRRAGHRVPHLPGPRAEPRAVATAAETDVSVPPRRSRGILGGIFSGLAGLAGFADRQGEGEGDLPPGTRFSQEAEIQNYLPYPELQPLGQLLKQWPPDEPDIPDIPNIAEGTLQRFDYSDPEQRAQADKLRLHEVPFMLYNVPSINDVKEKWGQDEYLKQRFGDTPLHVTTSDSNHFMYFNRQSARRNRQYRPKTGHKTLQFSEWMALTRAAEHAGVDDPHYYLQLNSVGPFKWIADDIYDFQPKRSFFIVEPHQNRGINCRFGARGIIAEAHYDGGRNFVAMLRGAKRYILLPPEECPNTYLYPRGHPEARHSEADWSDLDVERFPKLVTAKAAQVVVRAGEVLYIPSYWFHYIVSTGFSAQCNTRSGNAMRGRQAIRDCGFY